MALVILPCDLPHWPTLQNHLKTISACQTSKALIDAMFKVYHLSSSATGLDPDDTDRPDPALFAGLERYLDGLPAPERFRILENTIPNMARRALDLKQLKPVSGVHFSLQQQPDKLEYKRCFLASLLAHAFFSTFPKRSAKTHPTLQDFNFTLFFQHLDQPCQKSKLQSFLHYFDLLETQDDEEVVSISRQVLNGKQWLTIEDWMDNTVPLCNLLIRHDGRLEESEVQSLGVSFCSQRVGGEVLQEGASKESVDFSTMPELISLLSSVEAIEDNEALLVKDAYRVASISDPRHSASVNKFLQPLKVSVCCIDAEKYSHLPLGQLAEDNLLRELNKALLGFRQGRPGATRPAQQRPVFQRRLSPIGESFSSNPSEITSSKEESPPRKLESPARRSAWLRLPSNHPPPAQDEASRRGRFIGQLDTITRAIARVAENRSSTFTIDQGASFVDYQTRMVARSKEIARLAQDMVTKSSNDPQKLGQLSSELARNYSQLANDSVGAALSTSVADVSVRIRSGIQLLGKACYEIVMAGNNCQIAPLDDQYSHRDLADAARNVSERVSQVLSALQAGSRGTQACINAASTVSGIIGDLDTTIMFATAGTLHAENENETFADHRENILKTAKALVEDTKTLVAGAASSQEQLAVAAQNAVSTIVQLAEVVKFGAASLGSNNPEAQVMLINAVKDVATALGDLIHATKSASGKGIDHPSMNHLKDSAKVMVTNVTSLLKTVKAVEDEHTRGTRALEATIEAIAQEIRALQSPEQFKSSAIPEDLVRCTKPITTATAKAVAAGNSGKQDDAIVAANVGRKAISDMLSICKGVANNAESAELRNRTLQSGHDVAVQYRELLQAILHILSKPGQLDSKSVLPVISRKIAQCVTDLVTSAQLLKGSDWVDPDDPTVIAENELLGAAASIDAAAKKLASLRPRRSIQETDESLNFDEMILEAAKSIAAATSALVKAASAAQRELIDLGKVDRRPLTSSDDGQWSEGLISAARLVAAATHSLVESANALVQGVSSEEKLVSAAKQVASSTAQLLVACKVKADPDAESTKRLQSAGNAVKRATDNLVRAAQQAIQQEEERSFVLNKRMVGGIAQEINARSEVFRIEKQLEEARSRLTAIRQAKYKLKGADSDGETDGYQSGYESFTTRYETRSYDASPALGQRQYSNLVSPEKVSDAELAKNLRMSPYGREVETISIRNGHGTISPPPNPSATSSPAFLSFGKNLSADEHHDMHSTYSSTHNSSHTSQFMTSSHKTSHHEIGPLN